MRDAKVAYVAHASRTQYSALQHQPLNWLLEAQVTCVEQPERGIGVAAKLGRINCSSLGGALEECRLLVAVIHKALADAAIGSHVVADLGQCVWQCTLLSAMTRCQCQLKCRQSGMYSTLNALACCSGVMLTYGSAAHST